MLLLYNCKVVRLVRESIPVISLILWLLQFNDVKSLTLVAPELFTQVSRFASAKVRLESAMRTGVPETSTEGTLSLIALLVRPLCAGWR